MVLPLYAFPPYQGILWLRLKLSALQEPLRVPLTASGLVLGFLALLLLPLTWFLLRPYRALQHSLLRVAEGDFEHPLEEKRFPAFQELVKTFNLMRARLRQMMQQKQRLVADVSHDITRRARHAASMADDYAHDEPWKVAGVAALAGLAIGILLSRR